VKGETSFSASASDSCSQFSDIILSLSLSTPPTSVPEAWLIQPRADNELPHHPIEMQTLTCQFITFLSLMFCSVHQVENFQERNKQFWAIAQS